MTESFSFEAIGTHWQIDFAVDESSVPLTNLSTTIHQLIEDYDRHYSRFRSDSLVSQFTQQAGQWQMPADFGPLFELYEQLYQITQGKFTPLIGQTLVDAGYDAQYSLQPHHPLNPPPSLDILEWHAPYLTLSQPVLLDFGAAGKGYLVDLLAQILQDHQITHFTIDAGGDIFHTSPTPLHIGLENPQNFDQAIGVVTLPPHQSLAGSAGSRRQWDHYHHILDPGSLISPTHKLATWVIADSAQVSDALATSLFLTNPEDLLPYFKLEYLILYSDFSINQSSNFPGELFIKN